MTSSDWIAISALGVSALSLIVSVVFGLITRRNSREQSQNAADQLNEARKEFMLSRSPDVELKLYVQRTNRDQALFNEATNHDPSITITDLSCYAIAELPHGPVRILGLIGVTLSPRDSIKQKTTIDSAHAFVSEYFPGHQQIGFVVTEPDRQWSSDSERHPLTVRWSYKPRFAGAEEVKIEKKMFLEVFPSDSERS